MNGRILLKFLQSKEIHRKRFFNYGMASGFPRSTITKEKYFLKVVCVKSVKKDTRIFEGKSFSNKLNSEQNSMTVYKKYK